MGLTTRRNGLGFGPVRLPQLVAGEAVAAAVFLSWTFPSPTPHIATAVGVVVTAAIISLSIRGRGHRLMLAMRRRRLRHGDDETVTADALTALAPGLTIIGVTERNTEFGVAFDGTGWFTGIALRHTDPTAPAGLDAGTLDVVTEVLRDPATAISGIQLVNHMVPTPSAHLAVNSPCLRSYSQLLGDDSVVAHHMTWLTLRLNIPAAARTAAERGGRSVGARRAVASMTMRLAKRLVDAGIDHRVLEPDSLRVALTHSVTGETSVASVRTAGEHWNRWRFGVLAQVGYGVDGPVKDVEAVRKLWMSMAALPMTFFTIATSLHTSDVHGGDDGLSMRMMLRVAYNEMLGDGVPDKLSELATEHGLRLWRYDGAQLAATYATAPTGGVLTR